MNWNQLCKLGFELPEVEEGTSYRTPALKVRGKMFVRLKEDERTVVFLLESVEQQEFLIATRPHLYFITDHYRGYAAVLARLPELDREEARLRLREAWLQKAPARLQKQL